MTSNPNGRQAPIVNDSTASSFFKFLRTQKDPKKVKPILDWLLKFTKKTSKEEISMILDEFSKQQHFNPVLLQYIKILVSTNKELVEWDAFSYTVFYNDHLFSYLLDTSGLQEHIDFIISVAGQSPQWGFLLRYGLLKKLEIHRELTQEWIDPCAELLNTVLINVSKGNGMLSVDLLVQAASYFKKHSRLTLHGVVALLEIVSSSQQPKLATLQEYLVLLLQAIKTGSSTKEVGKSKNKLSYLNLSSGAETSEKDSQRTAAAPKKDLSPYYLVLKHLLASKKIKFEENHQLSKVIAPVYLPDLKTGVFIISISDSGIQESHPEAKLVKKVTRLIFERMIEGSQAVILYPTDFEETAEGSSVSSILDEVAASQQA